MQRLKIVSSALAVVFVLGASSTAMAQASQGGRTAMAASEAAAALKQDMRKLWTDHVVWTRDYIVAALGDQPGAQASANRRPLAAERRADRRLPEQSESKTRRGRRGNWRS